MLASGAGGHHPDRKICGAAGLRSLNATVPFHLDLLGLNVRRVVSAEIISRINATWASELHDVVPGKYEDMEHLLLLDAPSEAQAELKRRTANALRAAGYSGSGRTLIPISHQQAKALGKVVVAFS